MLLAMTFLQARFAREGWRRILGRLGIMAAGLALIALTPILQARYVRYRAERCVEAVLALKLGQSTFLEAEGLKQHFGGTEPTLGNQKCVPEACTIAFRFQNSWLAYSRLSAPTELDVGITIAHGSVVSRQVIYVSGVSGAYASLYVTEHAMASAGPAFNVHVLTEIGGEPKKVVVSLTSAASQAERQQAYSFDLSCISRLGGCKDRSRIFGRLAPAGS